MAVMRKTGKAALAALSLLASFTPLAAEETQIVRLVGASFMHRPAGEFISGSLPIDAPRLELKGAPLAIMKHQVSARDYEQCARDGACAPLPASAPRGDVPATQVNLRDAMDYAAWLSRRSGAAWRLPTDEEWVFAAAERAPDDALVVSDANNPALRWLARYDREFGRAEDGRVHPLGSSSENSNGLSDLSGSVWEWTSSCYVRTTLESGKRSSTENCGVRVVQGAHRSYMTDFIRDPKSGGCAVGKPPSHLGFRLVREEPNLVARLRSVFRSASN